MVFQIADDALDLVSTTEAIGKPAGSDIREGKFTVPVLLALETSAGDRIRQLLGAPRPYDDAAVGEVIDLVRAGGHVDASLELALDRLRRADEALSILPEGPALDVLHRLGTYLVDRVTAVRS
jgi:geranylgeranyl pyrophosphate synthase